MPSCTSLLVSAAAASTLLLSSTEGFSVAPPPSSSRSKTSLNMGIFDGVKDAFAAPALERSVIDAERETPIDRWFGWSVTSDADQAKQQKAMADFVDSMDESNYVSVALEKPMGIVFEENDEQFGGIFVQSLKEDGVAAKDGTLKEGDQLVAVTTTKVAGWKFDEALSQIVESPEDQVKLTVFRGSAPQLYGPTGASQDWLDEFCAKQ